MAGALDGVKVLEFSQIIAAPFCGQLLAEMGADVIKVEPPGGEPWRVFAQFIPFESKTFIGLNRGKRSLPLDFNAPEAREIIRKLVAEVDVVIVNYRPDVPARAGIDYETLSAINPRLIYCENTAFGRRGPDSYRPGYDIIIQAMSGLMAANNKTLNSVPQVPALAAADFSTGLAMAWAICAALFARERTGKGQKVEAALLSTALAIQSSAFLWVDAVDTGPITTFLSALQEARDRSATWDEMMDLKLKRIPPQVGNIYYRTYKTKDGYLAVGNLSLSLRKKMAAVLGLDDPRFTNPEYDIYHPDNQAELNALVTRAEALMETKTTAEWLKLLDAAGVPSGPVRFVEELFEDPQVLANDMVVEIDHPLAGRMRTAGPVVRMSETPTTGTHSSPALGQHTREILSGLGYSDEQIVELVEKGVTRDMF